MNYKILEFLHENRERFVSVDEMASKLDLNLIKSWKYLKFLRIKVIGSKNQGKVTG